MIVVSDTSPINYLLLIGLIDILSELFGKVIIPNAVYAELCHPGAPQVVGDWVANLPDWVEVRTVLHPDPSLELGAGESEAITLAVLIKADALLIDERKGRREAVARGLVVSGTLNVLEEAAERGLIDFRQACALLLLSILKSFSSSNRKDRSLESKNDPIGTNMLFGVFKHSHTLVIDKMYDSVTSGNTTSTTLLFPEGRVNMESFYSILYTSLPIVGSGTVLYSSTNLRETSINLRAVSSSDVAPCLCTRAASLIIGSAASIEINATETVVLVLISTSLFSRGCRRLHPFGKMHQRANVKAIFSAR